MNAPERCLYCEDDDATCGFCENGKPLDTQEDWDRSWGRILDTSSGSYPSSCERT